MQITTVLFVCPDNSLLGPLAEAYLNARGAGMVRAFSGGAEPEAKLHRSVGKLLAARNLSTEGLEPKSLDVFLMPMAPRPDRIIVLADMAVPVLPDDWQGRVGVTRWPVAGRPPFPVSCDAAAEYFRRIRQAIDRALVQNDQPRTAA